MQNKPLLFSPTAPSHSHKNKDDYDSDADNEVSDTDENLFYIPISSSTPSSDFQLENRRADLAKKLKSSNPVKPKKKGCCCRLS